MQGVAPDSIMNGRGEHKGFDWTLGEILMWTGYQIKVLCQC